MEKKVPNPEITDAVKKLRQAVDETQAEFAKRLNVATSSLVRYESTRAPHGKVLAQLAAIAEEHGQHESVRIFRQALADEVGEQVQPKIDFRTDEEREYVLALLAVLRNPDEYAKELRDVKRTLKNARLRNEKELEQFRTRETFKRAMFNLLQEGRTVVSVADVLGLPIQVVEKAAKWQPFFQTAKDVGLLGGSGGPTVEEFIEARNEQAEKERKK